MFRCVFNDEPENFSFKIFLIEDFITRQRYKLPLQQLSIKSQVTKHRPQVFQSNFSNAVQGEFMQVMMKAH